jgi:hypothetical protein
MTLEEKQQELLTKNKQRRSKQNSRNARGPRKQPTRRSPRSAVPWLRGILADPAIPIRAKLYAAYMLACFEKMNVLSYQEFYKYKEGEESSVENEIAAAFQIRLPEKSGSGQTDPAREAVSVG